MKARAKYNYTIDTIFEQETIMIIDEEQGISVANDIENVVSDIAEREKIDPKRFLIIYKDTDGRWDGWDAIENDFFFIGGESSIDSVSKYKQGKIC